MVAINFNLMIGDLVNSEFISLMTVDLAKELISSFGFGSVEEPPEAETSPVPPAAAQAPQPVPVPVSEPQPVKQQPIQQKPAVKQSAARPDPRPNYDVQSAAYQSFDEEENQLTDDQSNNLNMIMSVPLEIMVEIGRTTKKIKDILDFTSGTILELDKQAGSQVDVFVNGKQIAKGDVVVVDDFYGVRITEISSNSEIMKVL